MQEFAQLTPLMRQYFEIKSKFPDALLLFQVGDFYELFFEDAKIASSVLAIALTKRGNINGDPIPLCGVPLHVLDHHLSKLVKSGYKVAICNQLEQAVPGKVVQRGVVQVLTPGTLTDCKLLNPKSSSYLLSFFASKHNWAIVFGELLTAQLYATILPNDSFKLLENELARFAPDEILISQENKTLQNYFKQHGYFVSFANSLHENDINSVLKNFKDEIVFKNNALLNSLYNFITYIKHNQQNAFDQFNKINFYKPDDFLILDSATQKNLDLVKYSFDSSNKNTLLELMDKSATAMGSRTIKKWILRPLIKKESILQRQNAIEFLIKNIIIKDEIFNLLTMVGDIERIIGRIALKRAQFHDYLNLSNALNHIASLKLILSNITNIELLNYLNTKLSDFADLNNLLKKTLNDDFNKDCIIKIGFNPKLDDIRQLAENSNNKILQFEQQEQNATGISSLKVRFNNISGYYIEVTKTNLENVPAHYIRQQTLSGKERFVTTQLQALQFQINSAKKEIAEIENNIFEEIKSNVHDYLSSLRHTSFALCTLDALLGFAKVSYENGWICPEFNDENNIIINDGKNPIIAQIKNKNFIANNTNLTQREPLWIITGPNMGGKSTYLRQVAFICILAQCGSFVPASSASLPILDRIFTRIGAGDNLAEGKSTFLVEMEETANICSQATQKSLVILDEVGRGTSTFDGLAIAQAVVEYIYTNIKAKCLFATHYHELTNLHGEFNGISAYHMSSAKKDNGIIFLHKLVKGAAQQSYGIEVARLANLPDSVIQRAKQLLDEFKQTKQTDIIFEPAKVEQKQIYDVSNNLLKSKIQEIDFDELTAKKAYDILWQLKDLV